MLLVLVSIKPEVGHTKSFSACYFLELCLSDFVDFSFLVLCSFHSNVLEVLETLCNREERIFQDDNNTPTNQTRVTSNKIYLCSYLY
jgi:hypothetical protein